MSLWDWALAAYARPEVAPACLSLQDDYGQNVCLLLWAVWANPNEAVLKSGSALAREWDQVVLRPLRGVRRRLPAGELREEVKAVELKAEKALLIALEGLAAPVAGSGVETLVAASTVWGSGAGAPRQALQRLADAVSGIQAPR